MLKWISKLLAKTANWTMLYPKRIVVAQLILAVISIWYTVEYLQFSTNRNELVGEDQKYHKIFLKYQEEFPNQDDIVVVVESDNFERNRMFVELLGARLEAETNLFTDVFYKGDMKMMGNKALLFSDESMLIDLEAELKNYAPFIQDFVGITNLTDLFDYVNDRFMRAQKAETQENLDMINTLPALDRILGGAHGAVTKPGVP
ncbi:MAG: RND transporter, partial [Clostridia bacterium]|nr:RND transporter [Clostridia bacterium]